MTFVFALGLALALPSAQAAIFGDDDRIDLRYSKNPIARKYSHLSVAFVHRKDLIWDRGGFQAVFKKNELCAEEKFSGQRVLSDCSGIFIGTTQILTAGHCIMTEDQCRDVVFVTGYQAGKSGAETGRFGPGKFYGCKRIQKIAYQSRVPPGLDRPVLDIDYAILETRQVNPAKEYPQMNLGGRTPLEGTKVFTIGYPMGLPAKLSHGEIREIVTENRAYTDLDTLGAAREAPFLISELGRSWE